MRVRRKSTNQNRKPDPVAAYRILRPEDARELAMLHAATFETSWSPAAFRSELSKPSVFGLGLLSHDMPEQIISFVIFQRALDEAEMLTLATDPNSQRRGNAKTLLKAAFSHLTERGVARCLLDVAEDNHGAIALYKKLDFEEDGRRKDYYKRADNLSVDALLMSCKF